MLIEMREYGKKGILWGEADICTARHIGTMRSSVRDLKAVCLHRNKEDTVESYMKHGSRMLRPQDRQKWLDGCRGGEDDIRSNAVKCYPMIDAFTTRQAFEFYWEYYEAMVATIAEPIIHLDVEDLNDDDCIKDLFDFLEIPDDDRVFIEKRKFYTSEDVETIREEIYGEPPPRQPQQGKFHISNHPGAGRPR
jgi:hypothetical protein